MTGGDVDADWESAYSVGDEAPGGDNPTPDQDIVDDIGRAVGVQYNDNEELKGEKKLLERDKHRWELDPASSDDWEDRLTLGLGLRVPTSNSQLPTPTWELEIGVGTCQWLN